MKLSQFHPNYFVAPAETVRKIQAKYVNDFPPGGRVADLGCGEGVFLELLRNSGREGIGVDITGELVEACRAKGLQAFQMDAFQFLRQHPSQFDGVFASHLIEHFPPEKALELLQLMYDALKPHGILILMTPTFADLLVWSERFWLDITHVRPYPLPLLVALLEHLEMEIVKKGFDRDTRIRPNPVRHPRAFARWIYGKVRFGNRFDIGDTFIVGRKQA